MHLRLLTGLFSIPPLAFMLTPTGRAIAATAWAWLKDVFGKRAAASPRGRIFVIGTRFPSGGEFGLLYSTYGPKTTSRLLKQLPAAVGGDCPTVPHSTANPKPLPPPVPPQLTAPQLLDSSELHSRPTQSAIPPKKRRPRARAGRRLTSSPRMGGYRSRGKRI